MVFDEAVALKILGKYLAAAIPSVRRGLGFIQVTQGYGPITTILAELSKLASVGILSTDEEEESSARCRSQPIQVENRSISSHFLNAVGYIL